MSTKEYKVLISDSLVEKWYNKDGQLHRENGPAVIFNDGTQEWHQNGKLHREDGPSVIYPNGAEYWHKNGKSHREDGPAVIYSDGTQKWYQNGKLHREDGPAVIFNDGKRIYFLEGEEICQNNPNRFKEIKNILKIIKEYKGNDQEMFVKIVRLLRKNS